MVLKTPSVLIVDDDDAICHLVCDGLTQGGYMCDIAEGADAALTKLRNHSFEVTLLDIKLPGVSGIDLLQMIKRNYQATAIVMISGTRDIDTVIESMKLGALDYIVKPFTVDKLISCISTVLKNSQRCSSVSNVIQPTEIISRGSKADNQSLNEINAIAYGIDAQVDYFDFHSKIVTERTIGLARQFGLPDRDINEWAKSRKEFYSKREGYIRSILSKLERNPLAQVMLGIAQPVFKFPRSAGEQN